MTKLTIRELLNDIENIPSAYELAERVEAVLSFCRTQKATFGSDLEHTDPVVRAIARGRVSAADQVLRALDGEP